MRYEQSEDVPEALRPASLVDLVEGNPLWMSDPRRTPVRLCAILVDSADFVVEVLAFEDTGAEWRFPFWDVSKFLCKPDAMQASDHDVALYDTLAKRLQAAETLSANPDVAVNSKTRITEHVKGILDILRSELAAEAGTVFDGWQASSSELDRLRRQCFRDAEVEDIDQTFLRHWISNPNAGEFVKAQRMVLARLGLVPFEGTVLRDPTMLTEPYSEAQRRRHILMRMAFMQATLSYFGIDALPLYRTVYSEHALDPPRNRGFVSSTTKREVALALLDAGEKTENAALYWQRVPFDRCFATWVETPALNARYAEDEVILLHDPAADLF